MEWDFSLANYGPVWSFMVQLGLLLLFMLGGNILRRTIPLFRKCLIPSALLGGALLLAVDLGLKPLGIELVDNHVMQVVTYHCLALGFAAMGLKTEKTTMKTAKSQVLEFGALQGGCYMLQAFAGLGITIVLFLLTRHSDTVISYIGGLLLPLGFGQGPGNALTWDVNFTNTPATMFAGNGSFGLALASIGFVVASVFGVLYINIYRRRGSLQIREAGNGPENEAHAEENEIPDNESVDKFTIQMGFVAVVYALSFGIMCLLGALSDFTNSIAWGFNFLWAADRVSGFAFALMIVGGVPAIEINDIKDYIRPSAILSLVGMAITYIYIRKVAKSCFKGFEHEFFLMSFGTMTGTASNGMILMKEIDPSLRTPTSSLYILSTFPAMVMIAPLLFLLSFAAGSFANACIACGIFFGLWVVYTVYLFRRSIFKKKYANKPEPVWQEESE